MSQTYQSRTPNHSNHKTAPVLPTPARSVMLVGAEAEAFWEHCCLTAYSTGFTVSPAMERLCKSIADQRSAIERLRCLTRADERERAAIAGYARRAAA
jgi:hypothetical protein